MLLMKKTQKAARQINKRDHLGHQDLKDRGPERMKDEGVNGYEYVIACTHPYQSHLPAIQIHFPDTYA